MSGQHITINDGKLNVPDNPIIPFIEGDGNGPDIWSASVRVFDAAVEKAYNGSRKIEWKEVLTGEKAFNQVGKLFTHNMPIYWNDHLISFPIVGFKVGVLFHFIRYFLP